MSGRVVTFAETGVEVRLFTGIGLFDVASRAVDGARAGFTGAPVTGQKNDLPPVVDLRC